MKYILILLAVLLTACSTPKQDTTPKFTPPSVVQVVKPIQEAKAKTAIAKTQPDKEAIVKSLFEIEKSLEEAEKWSFELQRQIDAQTLLLNNSITDKNQALEQAEYWHQKQIKALRELWIYRGILIAAISIMAILILIKLGIIGGKFLV